MICNFLRPLSILIISFFLDFNVFAQTHKEIVHANYAEVNIGYMDIPFSKSQLNSGYKSRHIYFSNAGIRIILGHQFSNLFAVQISYTAPFKYPEYDGVNGDNSSNAVWTTIAGISVKSVLPIHKKLSVYGEAGLSVISRKGFKINNASIVENASYAGLLLGAGLRYQLSSKLIASLNAFYTPQNVKVEQPHTQFYSAGIQYNPDLHPKSLKESKRIFPKHLIQLGYSTNNFGYGVNDFFSTGKIHVFWSGDIYIKNGISLQYQQHVYNSKKIFSLYWGTNFSYWQTVNDNNFFTVSVFPLLRINLLHTKPADIYFNYSFAGPSYISKIKIDEIRTGSSFTFQDFMGLGIFAGKHKKLNAEIKIIHYSNGNLNPDNPGLTIPLTFNIGYTF